MTQTCSDRTVLITGAGGFVGRYLLDALAGAGYAVAGTSPTPRPDDLNRGIPWFTADLRDASSLRVVPRRWWGIVHLAARSIPQSYSSVADVLENVAMTIELTDYLQGGRLLYVSSSHVYQTGPAALTEHSPERPAGRYGLSKLLCEQVVLSKQGRFDVRIARPFNHIGMGMSVDLVIPSIIRRIVEERAAAAPLHMLGKNSVRDFVDVRDVVDAYRQILEIDAPAQRKFNVCSGQPVAIGKIAEILLEISGRHRAVEFADSRLSTDDTDIMVGDAGLLGRTTGWQPRHTLRDSLDEMFRHYVCQLPQGAPSRITSTNDG